MLKDKLYKHFEISEEPVYIGFDLPDSGKHKRYKVDIVVDNVIIEYDGYYYHKERFDKDTEKTNRLKDGGYEVMRVREYPLNKITDNDIIVSGSYWGNRLEPYINSFYPQVLNFVEEYKR